MVSCSRETVTWDAFWKGDERGTKREGSRMLPFFTLRRMSQGAGLRL